jgi:hypothetical protein
MTLILKTSMAVKTDWIYRFQMSLPKEVHPGDDPRKEREVFPKTTENPIAVPEISLGQERNPATIRKAVLSEKDVVKERKNGRCF